MLLVIAKATGFYGHLREAGERFEIPEDEELGAWMVPANADGSQKLSKEQKAGKVPAEIVPQKPETGSVPSSAPFTPAAALYAVRHVPVGNFEVIDAEGSRVGELFEAVKGQSGVAKGKAQAEADRLNQDAAKSTLSPQQAAQAAQAAQVQEQDDNLPDA